MNRIPEFIASQVWLHPFWVGFSAFVLGNVACNLLSSLIYDFSTSKPTGAWGWAGYLLGFLFSFAALLASGFIGTSLLNFLVYPLSNHQAAKPRRVLISFLSRSEPQPVYAQEPNRIVPWSNQLGSDLAMLAESQDPRTSMSRIDATKPWSWAQVLRMLAFHRVSGSYPDSTLRLVAFVCSPESLPQSPKMIEHLRRYREFESVEVGLWLRNDHEPHELVSEHHRAWDAKANGWDFNSYQEL